MDSKTEFLPLETEKSKVTKHKIHFKKGILKSKRHIDAGTLHIVPKENHQEQDVEYFQPVYHGDQVIGIIHKCACERVSEIHFEYESDSNRDTKPRLDEG